MNINYTNIPVQKSDYLYKKDIRFSHTCSNLAPLNRDTVSFSGRRRLIAESMKDAPAEKTCRQVEANAEPARFYLEEVLNKYLEPYTQLTDESNPKVYPILKYSTRIKSAMSIREKVVSKYTKNFEDDSDRFSQQTVDLMMENFKLNKGTTREILINDVNNIVLYSSTGEKIPPYQNAAYDLTEILSNMEELKRFDFSECTPEFLKSAYTDMVEKLEEKAEQDNSLDSAYIDPTNISGIKHYANDIVGARITMRESAPEYTSIVIDALKQAVSDGVLKITSIENNIPDPKKLPKNKNISDYKYVSDSQLKSLAKLSKAPLIQNKSKTGYMAIHINVDLSNDVFNSYNGIYNGYSGEIQIMGSDVEELKDVEDLCYKLKDAKNAVNIAYKPFKTHFLKYYNDNTKDAFDNYTYSLYLAQRAIPPGSAKNSRFPGIEELGYKDKVPTELDFNILRQLKRACDIQIQIMNQNQYSNSKITPSNQDLLKVIKREGDIKTLKSLISYIIR